MVWRHKFEPRTEELEQRNEQLAEARARLAEEKLWVERSEAYMAEAQRLEPHWKLAFERPRLEKLSGRKSPFAILGFDSKKPKLRILCF